MTTTIDNFYWGRVETTKFDENFSIKRRYEGTKLKTESYYHNDKLHRDENDLPASVDYDTNGNIEVKYWYINGEQIRYNGGPIYERYYNTKLVERIWKKRYGDLPNMVYIHPDDERIKEYCWYKYINNVKCLTKKITRVKEYSISYYQHDFNDELKRCCTEITQYYNECSNDPKYIIKTKKWNFTTNSFDIDTVKISPQDFIPDVPNPKIEHWDFIPYQNEIEQLTKPCRD